MALGVSVLGLCAGTVSHAAVEAVAGRPNLVFVFSDQQSFDMLGCAGNKDIITPNLDKLAAEGVRFTQCISSSPVCTPFRGMLLTGQHPLRSGAFCNDIRWPHALKPRLSELLIGPLDIMPTLLSMLNLNLPETCQGRNLADAIFKAQDDTVDSIPLFLFPWQWRGIYTGAA